MREQGRAEVNEDALFAMVEQMRAITETAVTTTRKARRDVERASATPPTPRSDMPAAVPPASTDDLVTAAPFEVIEEW